MRLLYLVKICTIVFLLYHSSFSYGNKDSIIELIKVTQFDDEKVVLYLQLGNFFKDNNSDSSFYYTNKALKIAILDGDTKSIAKSYFQRGKNQLRRDSIFQAREDFYIALNFLKECECYELKASILMYLGKSYSIQDNYYEAIDYLMQSLMIAENINNLDILSDLYDDIGLLLYILDNSEDAMNYFDRALVINEEKLDKRNYATTLRNIGFTLIEQKVLSKAEATFEKAFHIYQDIGDDWGMATVKFGLGNVQFQLGNYDSALIIYQQGLENALKIDIRYKESGPVIQSWIYNRIGETYFKLGDYDKAISALRKSSDLAEEYTLPGRKAEAAKYFSQIYEKLGNTSMAHDYYKVYDELSDSIINAKNVSKITKLEMEYRYLKKQKEREIEQLKKDADYKRKMLLYEMIALVSLLVIVAVITIFLLYRNIQRNKVKRFELVQKNLELEKSSLQNELDFKNKELTTSVMYQLKKNNFIATVSKRLKEINLNLSSTHKKSLISIVKELEANMSQESWEEFEYRFNSVHNNFYDGLLRDHPNLTPNELKICAFLKLNMTSKDISTITYTSPQSITVARHRLRSKLGLSRDDNLVTFLSKY